jgi:hypothetical protein
MWSSAARNSSARECVLILVLRERWRNFWRSKWLNVAPVIERELRAESRRPANYWLRVLAAGALISAFATLVIGTQLGVESLGASLFAVLHGTQVVAFWIIVPLMTADCISREKREGTIGLLFLTPLTVLDVILGKTAIHAIRALTLFLAALPVLGLPLFLGGVGWQMVATAVVEEASAVLLGIAAGVYASTKGGSEVQVMVCAEAYALGLAICLGIWSGIYGGICFRTPLGLGWFLAGSILFALGLFAMLMNASVDLLKRTWQQEAAGSEQPRWVRWFSNSKDWQAFFRWNKSRTLDRNPVAWLQEYSWTARLTKWGWLIAAIFAEFVVLAGTDILNSPTWQLLVTVTLGLGVSFSAVRSFRREHEIGVLELLLVTPLSGLQLLRGRLWGICCHYLPAIAVLLVGWDGDRILNSKAYSSDPLALILPNPLAFVAIMIVGLYLSLGRMNFFIAWLLTWTIAFLIPNLLALSLVPLAGVHKMTAVVLASAFQGVLAVSMWFLLNRKMRLRAFVAEKRPSL